jgi:hypothetical protein
MITTARNMQDLHPDDIEVADLVMAGLPRACVIRLTRLTTLEWNNGVRRIGVLAARERQAVAARYLAGRVQQRYAAPPGCTSRPTPASAGAQH